jgi:hypothetical protein
MHVALPAVADRKRIPLERVYAEIMKYSGPSKNNVTQVAGGQTRFHDDQSLYSGVHGQGGPSTVDDTLTLENMMDRGEYDVRGRKAEKGQGHLSNGTGERKQQQQAGSANKKGGVYDRLTDNSKYTGVHGKGGPSTGTLSSRDDGGRQCW